MQLCSPSQQLPACTSPSSSPIWISSHLTTLSSLRSPHLLVWPSLTQSPPMAPYCPWDKFPDLQVSMDGCPSPPGLTQLHLALPVQILPLLQPHQLDYLICVLSHLWAFAYLFLEFPQLFFCLVKIPSFRAQPKWHLLQASPPKGIFPSTHTLNIDCLKLVDK